MQREAAASLCPLAEVAAAPRVDLHACARRGRLDALLRGPLAWVIRGGRERWEDGPRARGSEAPLGARKRGGEELVLSAAHGIAGARTHRPIDPTVGSTKETYQRRSFETARAPGAPRIYTHASHTSQASAFSLSSLSPTHPFATRTHTPTTPTRPPFEALVVCAC